MKQKLFVLVRFDEATGVITVHGNRNNEPYSNSVNALRAQTKRANAEKEDTFIRWLIREIE